MAKNIQAIRGMNDYLPGETAIWMLYPQNRRVPHKVRAFIDFMVEKIGMPPYWEEETH
mgnify:CR=1 FL=1